MFSWLKEDQKISYRLFNYGQGYFGLKHDKESNLETLFDQGSGARGKPLGIASDANNGRKILSTTHVQKNGWEILGQAAGNTPCIWDRG
jgi:hypothetical protein